MAAAGGRSQAMCQHLQGGVCTPIHFTPPQRLGRQCSGGKAPPPPLSIFSPLVAMPGSF